MQGLLSPMPGLASPFGVRKTLVTGLAVVAAGTTALSATWDAAAGVTRYDLRYRVLNGGRYGTAWMVMPGVTSPAAITTLATGEGYDVQVRADGGPWCDTVLGVTDYPEGTVFVEPGSGNLNTAVGAVFEAARLVLREGTHTLTAGLDLWQSGTDDANRFVIEGYPGEMCIVTASALAADTNAVDSSGSWQRFKRVCLDGDYTKRGFVLWEASQVELVECVVYRCALGGIYGGGGLLGAINNITARGNILYNNCWSNLARTAPGGWPVALQIERGEDIDFTDNIIFWNIGEGAGLLATTGGNILRNRVWENWSANIYLDNVEDIVVQENIVFYNGNTEFLRDGQAAFGIAVAHETYDPQIPTNNLNITNNIGFANRGDFPVYFTDFEFGGGWGASVVSPNTLAGAVDPAWLELPALPSVPDDLAA